MHTTKITQNEKKQLFVESSRRFISPGVSGGSNEDGNPFEDGTPAGGQSQTEITTKREAPITAATTAKATVEANRRGSSGGGGRVVAAASLPQGHSRRRGSVSTNIRSSRSSFSLTATMDKGGPTAEVPRAVWLGRVAAVMEARGDKDEAVRLYGEASAALTAVEEPAGGVDRSGWDRCRQEEEGAITRVGCIFGDGAGSDNSDHPAVVYGKCMNNRGSRNLFPYSARAHHLASMIERAYDRHFRR